MKKIIIFLFILNLSAPLFAATIGGPDIAIPEEAAYIKKAAIDKALDNYEALINIKAGFDMDFLLKKKLATPSEVSSAEMDGHSYTIKLSNNFGNIIEPYIKLGTAAFNVEWTQNDKKATLETEMGLMWGAGIKALLYEMKDYGVKLTLDTQYREMDMDVDEVTLAGSTSNLSNSNFMVKEWQLSLLASKRFILPVGLKDYYIVPYTGLTLATSDVDASFRLNGSEGILYSLYNAANENLVGVVLGCDVMPSLLSWYLINFELRLVNETALSLGGTIKF